MTSLENKDVEPNNLKLSPTKLSDLRARVAAESEEKRKAQSKFSLETIKTIWEEYKVNSNSTSTKSAMNQAIVDFQDKVIIIKVPSAATKNIILQESFLMQRYRDEFGMTDLTMDIAIDLSYFPDYEETKTVIVKSQREILEDFIGRNPILLQLMEKLDLKLDS